jgi:hypothetical protein
MVLLSEEDTAIKLALRLKLREKICALSDPLRNSYNKVASSVRKTLMSVPFSEAVANTLPEKSTAMA